MVSLGEHTADLAGARNLLLRISGLQYVKHPLGLHYFDADTPLSPFKPRGKCCDIEHTRVSKAGFTRQRSEQKPQKCCCVPTFYSPFRQTSLGGNLHAHSDAKVCEISCSKHARWLGGTVKHCHTTPPGTHACVDETSFYMDVTSTRTRRESV